MMVKEAAFVGAGRHRAARRRPHPGRRRRADVRRSTAAWPCCAAATPSASSRRATAAAGTPRPPFGGVAWLAVQRRGAGRAGRGARHPADRGGRRPPPRPAAARRRRVRRAAAPRAAGRRVRPGRHRPRQRDHPHDACPCWSPARPGAPASSSPPTTPTARAAGAPRRRRSACAGARAGRRRGRSRHGRRRRPGLGHWGHDDDRPAPARRRPGRRADARTPPRASSCSPAAHGRPSDDAGREQALRAGLDRVRARGRGPRPPRGRRRGTRRRGADRAAARARRRRAPERRQVDAGQPHPRPPRGRRRGQARRDPRPRELPRGVGRARASRSSTPAAGRSTSPASRRASPSRPRSRSRWPTP